METETTEIVDVDSEPRKRKREEVLSKYEAKIAKFHQKIIELGESESDDEQNADTTTHEKFMDEILESPSTSHEKVNVLSDDSDLEIVDSFDILDKSPSINETKDKTNAVELDPDLAKYWSEFIKSGISKADVNTFLDKYKVPVNCPLLVTPKINPELNSLLPKYSKTDHAFFASLQQTLSAGLAALGTPISKFMQNPSSITEDDITAIVDAGTLFCQASRQLRTIRRFQVIDKLPLKPEVKKQIKNSTHGEFLFQVNVKDILQEAGIPVKDEPKKLPAKRGTFRGRGIIKGGGISEQAGISRGKAISTGRVISRGGGLPRGRGQKGE